MAARSLSAPDSQGLVDPSRLRMVVTLLREAGPTGLQRDQLARKLEVSLRTVDRALRLLEEQGARLERVRAGRPALLHLVLHKGPTWDEHVSSQARLALRVAGLSLAQSGTLVWQDQMETLEQLASDHMSNRDRRLFEGLKRAVRVQGGVDDPIEEPAILGPILDGLEGRRELEIAYLPAGATTPSQLRVVPFTLTHDLFSGGAFLLVWQPENRRPLHLRFNRIQSVKVTGRTGALPEDLMNRAARFQIGGWTSGDAPFEVELLVRDAHWAQAFKEAPPALPDFTCDEEPGGGARVRFKATHDNGAIRWILQLGAAAEVIAPERVREAVVSQLREALARYAPDRGR
jgi:predicted DNA-binding transcriptional regulator YafY